MRVSLFVVFCFIGLTVFSQQKQTFQKVGGNGSLIGLTKSKRYQVKDYLLIRKDVDSVFVDTTLTHSSLHRFNFLRKDDLELLPFSNIGHVFNKLSVDFNTSSNLTPLLGARSKALYSNSLNSIYYYQVPKPLTQFYFKTVSEQGQSLQTKVTFNFNKQTNFTISYSALKSIGKYINNISSLNNLYINLNSQVLKRYTYNINFYDLHLSNGENGGIVDPDLFIENTPPFEQRDRLDVFHRDTKVLYNDKKLQLDHGYQLFKRDSSFFSFKHGFVYKYQTHRFNQAKVDSLFGEAFYDRVNVQSRQEMLKNQFKLSYRRKLGEFQTGIDYTRSRYWYRNQFFDSSISDFIPSELNDKITSLIFNSNLWFGEIRLSSDVSYAISEENLYHFRLGLNYQFTSKLNFNFSALSQSKLPDNFKRLFINTYLNYNWFNKFYNEKLSLFKASINYQTYFKLIAQYGKMKQYVYFSDTSADENNVFIRPIQASDDLTFYKIKVSSNLSFGKFRLDGDVIFQQVDQRQPILNIPKMVARSSISYSNHLFKKALKIQLGLRGKYFFKYYADSYNPILSSFYVQNSEEIGAFPLVDLFLNAKVRSARLFVVYENVNSSLTGFNYFSAPNYPYRDRLLRFGIVWDLFK